MLVLQMKQIFTALLLLILLNFPAGAQNKNENDIIDRLDRYLSGIEKVGFNGTVLVELNGEKVISKGYGYSNKDEQLRNSPAAIFDIGSITKQFTAAAILKLEMNGKLSTGDKLSKYFENVPQDKANITIHDLLRHQSGLTGGVGRDYEKISEEDFLGKVFSSELRSGPGSKFSYSNIGYSLLAMIIEKVSGQAYETFLYENLWKPSGMEMTGYMRPAFDTSLIAVGYYRDDRVWGKPTEKEWGESAPYWHLNGNGGILSTTEDLFKWHKALMADQILSPEAKRKFYHPELRTDENETIYYAYGWEVFKTDRNTRRVWHNGSNNFFYADFMRFIDEDITLIMLTNKSHPNFDDLNFTLSRIIFNEEYNPEIPVEDNEANRNFTNRIIKTIEDSGIEQAKEEFIKKDENEKLLEFMMRNAGFNFIDDNKPEIGMKIFEMNVFVYPGSPEALQALGEGYMETGKNELALKYFKQSLDINPDNPFIKDMIKKLEE
jgi:CubicO group peptidase (beta-lactamase class C family)